MRRHGRSRPFAANQARSAASTPASLRSAHVDAAACNDASVSPATALRRAGDADVEAIAAIQEAASVTGFAHVFPPDRYPFPLQSVRERWSASLSDSGTTVILAEEAGRPLGFASVVPGWLDALYVLPVRWGSGTAALLHDHALALLRKLGSPQAQLWVLEENERARRFYERRGWQANGKTRVVPFPPHPIDVGYTVMLE